MDGKPGLSHCKIEIPVPWDLLSPWQTDWSPYLLPASPLHPHPQSKSQSTSVTVSDSTLPLVQSSFHTCYVTALLTTLQRFPLYSD